MKKILAEENNKQFQHYNNFANVEHERENKLWKQEKKRGKKIVVNIHW